MTDDKKPREFCVVECSEKTYQAFNWSGKHPNAFVTSFHVIEYSAYIAEKGRAQVAESRIRELEAMLEKAVEQRQLLTREKYGLDENTSNGYAETENTIFDQELQAAAEAVRGK